jgi:hypothetical protein
MRRNLSLREVTSFCERSWLSKLNEAKREAYFDDVQHATALREDQQAVTLLLQVIQQGSQESHLPCRTE